MQRLLHNRMFLPFVAGFVFIILNTLLIANEWYWLWLLPAAGVLTLLYFFASDKVLLLITFLTPLAVTVDDYSANLGVSLPTEPLMAGMLLLFVVKLFKGGAMRRELAVHPVSIIIYIMLAWMFLTSITSEIPLVSFKALLARLWFVVPFFFMGVALFRKAENVHWFAWLYALPLVGVVFYTNYQHYLYGFDKQAAHWVMDPFYNDHTAYGAALAMYVPLFIGLIFNKKYSQAMRMATVVAAVILSVGLLLSMSRAAWLSAMAALMLWIVLRFRVRTIWLGLVLVVAVGLTVVYQDTLMTRLEKNKQDSSADFKEHVQSISNISSDASNLERLNRWQAGFRMFNERPHVGWGPGTYQFVYAPYQRTYNKTVISTNAGNLGNVHSEYLGPMAEWGWPGLIIMLTLIFIVVRTAVRLVWYARDDETRYLALIFFLSLVTYYVHGLLNNFLDTDKASVPFWGFTAVIVALDLRNRRGIAQSEESPAIR